MVMSDKIGMKVLIFAAASIALFTPAYAADIGQTEICKATIAAMMGRDPQIIKLDRETEGVSFLSYVRADDGTLWTYQCKLVGNEVHWATPGGRWRDLPEDGKVFYKVEQDRSSVTIKQVFSDGSELSDSYTADQL